MSQEVIVVLMTAPDAETAARISQALVHERLAACVNILPNIRSIYTWEGKVSDDIEVLCVIKTRRALFEAVRDRIVSLHPYQVPEVIALPLVSGHSPYLDWVLGSTREP